MSIQGGKIIYSGSKTFWKTKLNLEITIVNHPRFSCLEVIAYDAHINVEYPRLYINSLKLKDHVMTSSDFQQLLDEKNDWMIRHKLNNSDEEVKNAVCLQLMNNYIVSHVFVHVDENPNLSNQRSIVIRPSYNETSSVVRERPMNLIPYHITPHEMFTTYKNFSDVLSHVEQDLAAVDLNCKTAESFEHAAEKQLSSLSLKAVPSQPELSRQRSDEQDVILAKRKYLRKMSFSQHNVARLRWFHAIHKVIMHNKVKAIRRRLLQEQQENAVQKTFHPHRPTHGIPGDSPVPESVFSFVQFPYSKPNLKK